MMEFRTTHEDETIALGARLGELLQAGDVVALHGDLGSGKTMLTKGLAAGLGVADAESEVNSPTFVFVRVYEGRVPVYHMDLYRLHEPAAIEQIGWNEYAQGDGVAVIEWADRALPLLPAERLDLHLAAVSLDERRISIEPLGRRYQCLLERLEARA